MNVHLIWGLLAVLGIWVCNGITLPMISVLKLSGERLMIARGLITAAFALVITQGNVSQGLDNNSALLAICFAFACLGLYKGVRAWGASRTIIIVTLTPIVNFCFAAKNGVPVEAFVSFGVMLFGVYLVLGKAKERPTNWISGVGWSLFGTAFNGFFYEAIAVTKTPVFQATFWQAIAVAVIGWLALTILPKEQYNLSSPGLKSTPVSTQRYKLYVALLLFGLIGGLAYFLSNIIAFTYLPKVVASVLAQGESPMVVLIDGLLTPKNRLSAIQWGGALLTLAGAVYLTWWLVAK